MFSKPFFFSFFVPHLHTPTSTYILLPHRTFYISLMLSTPVIMGVIVLMMIVVSGDDTQALRDTISSLCSLNKVGKFASCCGSYDNGASITLAYSSARACFIYNLRSATGSVLTSLFVICFIFVLFLLFDDCRCFSSFFIFRSFQFRGLSVLGKGVFSSLTNLNSLLSLLLILSSIHFFLHSFPSFWSFQANSLVSIESRAFNGLNNLLYLPFPSLPPSPHLQSLYSFLFFHWPLF